MLREGNGYNNSYNSNYYIDKATSESLKLIQEQGSGSCNHWNWKDGSRSYILDSSKGLLRSCLSLQKSKESYSQIMHNIRATSNTRIYISSFDQFIFYIKYLFGGQGNSKTLCWHMHFCYTIVSASS